MHFYQNTSKMIELDSSHYQHHHQERLTLIELACLGGVAGMAANALMYPLDLLRGLVTIQHGPGFRSTSHSFSH
jgi:hypothetical protein